MWLAVFATLLCWVRVAHGEPSNICILPLGDSLTQGVGDHGSYRQPLDEMLRSKWSSDVASFHYAGSLQHGCKPKQPRKLYTSNTIKALAHEGHCGRNSAAILSELRSNVKEYGCKPNIVLLMAGHNDVFQVMKLCKVREGAKTGDVECMKKHFSDFQNNVRSMVAVLRDGGMGVAVLMGKNPPTGFPVADAVLHGIIDGLARELSLAGVVAFQGFTTGVHTFDTTHPNAKGARLIAEAWLQHMSPIVARMVKVQQGAAAQATAENERDDTHQHVMPVGDGQYRGLEQAPASLTVVQLAAGVIAIVVLYAVGRRRFVL